MMKLFKNFEIFVSYAVARASAKKSRLSFENDIMSDEIRIAKTKSNQLRLENLLPHFILGYSVLFTGVFLLSEAEEFVEFSDTFYPFVTALLNFITVSLVIRNGEKLFELKALSRNVI